MANTHSLDFESGSSQYLSVADTTVLDISGSITIEAWVNFESNTGTEMTFLAKYKGNTDQRSYLFEWQSGNLYLYLSSNGTAGGGVFSTSNVAWTPTLGTWYHVAVTHDALGNVKFYVNGVQQGTTQTGALTTMFNSTAALTIGGYSNASPQSFFDGLIDEVRLWNVVRTETQINAYKQKDVSGQVGLIGYWKMNNNFLDSSGNGLTLTNNNSVAASASVPYDGEASVANPLSQLGNVPYFRSKELSVTSLFASGNLRAYYKLENGALTTDSTANGLNLTNNNTATSVAGRFGGAASFVSASSQYLSISNALLRVNGSKTLMGWIKLANITDTHTVPFGTSNSASTQDFRFRQFQAQLFVDCDPLSASGQALASGLVAGKWYHVAMVYDSTANTLKGYFNGGLVINSTGVTGTQDQSGTDFAIGRNGANAASYFNGDIDDVAFFNSALTESDIKAIYREPTAYWKLENVNDSSNYGRTLTNNGTVTFTSGKFNNGASLGTSNSSKYLSINEDLNIIGTPVSISMWVKVLSAPGTGVVTRLFEVGDSTTDTRFWIQYHDTAGVKLLNFNRQKENSANQGPTYTVDLGTTNFYHLVLTYDGSHVRGYINGSEVGIVAASGNGISGVDIDYFYIGAGRTQAGAVNNHASALVDDVAVFQGALTPAEVFALYTGVSSSGAFLTLL